jgi:hypothetical protein
MEFDALNHHELTYLAMLLRHYGTNVTNTSRPEQETKPGVSQRSSVF